MSIATPSRHQQRFAAALTTERPRLIRLCAMLTGAREAAEDLAQETLLEAWRGAETLRDEAKLSPWLSGIARNVCRRWLQRQRDAPATDDAGREASLADDDDLAIELERDELAVLLDRALGLLPATTRDVLIARFVDECSHAEIASRLGLSEGTVTVRIHRGKLALRRVLTGPELRPEAASFGIAAESDDWQRTRISCPFCGQHPLMMRRDGTGELWYRCAGICLPTGTIMAGKLSDASSAVLRSPKSILTRELAALHGQYRQMLREGESTCDACGRPLPVEHWLPGDWPAEAGPDFGLHLRCPSCGMRNSASMWHLTLDLPETQRFWRRHPRMRALPVTELAHDGRPALRTGFMSRDDTGRLEVIADHDTYEILRIDGTVER